MDGWKYDFKNTGYKMHIPVAPNSNDPLTRKIADFLDKKFGLQPDYNTQYYSKGGFYKVGSGGELEAGKGITLYGTNSSMHEMKELAKEIEQKFGKELEENVKKYNIQFEDPIKLSKSLQAKFAVHNHGYIPPNTKTDIEQTLMKCCNGNPSGAIPTRFFTTIDGKKLESIIDKGLSDIDKKFWFGDSTMYAIDNFGELFTGRIENGRVPQFIMDGLPKEYLRHYNLAEKDIVERINNGTVKIVANMLEDIANNPDSKILNGNPPWFTTLDKKFIADAKELLTQKEPKIVEKLEQMLPQLEKKCPSFCLLREKVLKNAGVEKAEVILEQEKVLFETLGKKGKVGIALTGAALAALAIYGITTLNKKSENKEDAQVVKNIQISSNTTANPVRVSSKMNYKNPCYNPGYNNIKI